MILFGASGHAKVIIDILEKSGKKLNGLIDGNPDIESLLAYEVNLDNGGTYENEHMLVAIGVNHIRKKISERLRSEFFNAVHPAATLNARVKIGVGTAIMAGAVVNSCTEVGNHAIINTRSSVDHDCSLSDYVHISPGATLCGGVHIGEGTHIGAGATVIPGITIGNWVTVGAGSVIIRDIPDNAVVVGNPGRIIKYND